MHLGTPLARAAMALFVGFALAARGARAQGRLQEGPGGGAFGLVQGETAAPICVDAGAFPGVLRAARDLQSDVERVSGRKPLLGALSPSLGSRVVLVGTLGRSPLIDGLVREGKVDASRIGGRWEAFQVVVVADPFPGVKEALVIAGSDKRGTIYGVYEVSAAIGVSPWYWWADVPVRHRGELFLRADPVVSTGPAVKYRGIFLNDEAPALTNWVKERFGAYNHVFYERIFELLLRMRANCLWPAMWDSAFNEDDPDNARLADEFGIVMGTSHHEPMLRAQQEWKRHGTGPWDYTANAPELRRFWTEGVRRNRAFESLYTVGMRGDGDLPMSESSNVALLERIVADQREILAREVNPDLGSIPQVWALYKEVQAYYEKGMRVPDDVTLLWCDDNWGNVRRLPTPDERKRRGGAGIYYHLDYVGDPRDYKWLATVPITKVWEQMHLAWESGDDRLWIVNVGSFKEKEFPMEFFLRYAWAPGDLPYQSLGDYTRAWAEREFGPAHAAEIAGIESAYLKFNGRRKPELLAPDTFSLVNYGEAEAELAGWRGLEESARRIQGELEPAARDAFYQLVVHPVAACRIVNELYMRAGLNRLYAAQGRRSTNDEAERVRALFREDAALTRFWDEGFAGGRWRHFMDQTHIGYTYWQQPVANVMPAVTEVLAPDQAVPAVAVEGSADAWPGFDPDHARTAVPELSPCGAQSRTFEVFNRGRAPFRYTANADVPWLSVEPSEGQVTGGATVRVSAHWEEAPRGQATAHVAVRVDGGRVLAVVAVPVSNPGPMASLPGGTFVEADGVVSIEAEHFARAEASGGVAWSVLPDFGRTLSGVMSEPVTAPSSVPAAGSPRLEYEMYLGSAGDASVDVITAPTLAYAPGRGLRYAVSFDDGSPQVMDLAAEDNSGKGWERMVSDGVHHSRSRHKVEGPGLHVLKLWRVDPGVVIEKIVVDMGGLRPSYLGPPESARNRGAPPVKALPTHDPSP